MSGKTDVRIVPKPWGHETIWAHTDQYVGKVLHIKAGHALSVQYHNRKDETIHLLSGKMIYRVGKVGAGRAKPEAGSRKPEGGTGKPEAGSRKPEVASGETGEGQLPELESIEFREGESFRNEPGTVHQMEAVTDCVLLEASTPHLDDVVRLTDRYGRAGTSAP